MRLGNITINKYYCRWIYANKRHKTERRKMLHSTSLENVKQKAIKLFGRKPDEITLIG